MSYLNELADCLLQKGPATRPLLATRTNTGHATLNTTLEKLMMSGLVRCDNSAGGRVFFHVKNPPKGKNPVLDTLRRLGPRTPQQLINSPSVMADSRQLYLLEVRGLIRWTPDGRRYEISPSREELQN